MSVGEMVVFLHFWKVSEDKRGFCWALALCTESLLPPCSQFLCRWPSVSLYLPTYLFPAAYLAVAVLCWRLASMLRQSTFGKQNSRQQQNSNFPPIPFFLIPQLPRKIRREQIRTWKRCPQQQPTETPPLLLLSTLKMKSSSLFSDNLFFTSFFLLQGGVRGHGQLQNCSSGAGGSLLFLLCCQSCNPLYNYKSNTFRKFLLLIVFLIILNWRYLERQVNMNTYYEKYVTDILEEEHSITALRKMCLCVCGCVWFHTFKSVR